MMIEISLLVSVLGSYAIAISDQFNLTVTIPPGYALQNYLCSGSLKSNTGGNRPTTVVLDDTMENIASLQDRSAPFSTKAPLQ